MSQDSSSQCASFDTVAVVPKTTEFRKVNRPGTTMLADVAPMIRMVDSGKMKGLFVYLY